MTEEVNEQGSWQSWGKHVLLELQRSNKNYEELRDDVALIKQQLATKDLTPLSKNISQVSKDLSDHKIQNTEDITTLKLKSGLWGAVAGSLASIVPLLMGLAIWFIKG